jgi:CotH protein/lamin tail-like protein/parallel beta helix pectate lyase-like protein
MERNQFKKLSLLVCILFFTTAGPIQATLCPLGDLNGDCQVNLVDVQILTGYWLDPGCMAPGCEADLAAGGGVDLIDYVWMAANHDKTGVHVVISEFMADNEGSFFTQLIGELVHPDWIEIYNPSDVTVDLGGCYLIDSNYQWPFPPRTILPGNSYLVVFASGQDDDDYPVVDDLGYLHTNFKLDKDGDYIALVLPDGSTVEHQYPATHPEPEEYSQQYDDWSYGLSPDLQGEGYFSPATPGQPNTSNPLPDPTKNVVISEIMYHPYHSREGTIESEPTELEYIELYNRGILPVSLENWRLSDGVDFTFPDFTLETDQFLVIAADVAAFTDAYPSVDPNFVVGGWQGRLSNSGEDIDLDDENGLRMDSVHYYDQGDWAMRELGPEEYNHRGWQWSNAHDGDGKSLELIQPALSNNYGQNWGASSNDGGTPGVANSVASDNIAPMILEAKHRPLIPRPQDPVTITARILDESTETLSVNLHYRVDTSTYIDHTTYPEYNPVSYEILPMLDDGLHQDGRAGDGVYGVTLSTEIQQDGTVIECFIQTDDGTHTRTWPAPSDIDETPQQVTNLLYCVDENLDPDETWQPGSFPRYYLVMTGMELGRLAVINSDSYNAESHAQMHGTFISRNGTGSESRYNIGIRNRGESTRAEPPYNRRINFPSDQPWKGVDGFILNAQHSYLQTLGLWVFQRADVPIQDSLGAKRFANGDDETPEVSPTYGAFSHHEVPDSAFAANHFPDDPGGNIYKAVRTASSQDLARLDYRGPDKDDYRNSYEKKTNTAEDNWDDLIELTYVLSNNTPDEIYIQEVEHVIDVKEWLRYFAVHTLIGNDETNLGIGDGDDYYLYCGVSDPRSVLIGYDLDSIFNLGLTSGDHRYDSLFQAVDVAAIDRFLTHPEIAPKYYQTLKELIETVFAPEQFHPFVDHLLSGWVTTSRIDQIKSFVADRNAYVLSKIPQEFTIQSDLPDNQGYSFTTSSLLTQDNIHGAANAIETYAVRINGQLADWQPVYGDPDSAQCKWAIATGDQIQLQPGINRIIVQTYDDPNGVGNVLVKEQMDVWYDDGDIGNVPNPLTESDTVLDAASGPWYVASNLTIEPDQTLTIEPGTTVYFNQDVLLTVNGRLVAEGAPGQRIHLTLNPAGAATRWQGIRIENTLDDNRMCYLDMDYGDGQGESIYVRYAKLLADNMTWGGTTRTCIEMVHPSVIVRNSTLHGGTEVLHGEYIENNEYLIVEGNLFEYNFSGDDVIDFLGADRPGPVLQILNNVFMGGGDDGMDLDGTDAHIEGNLFMNFHKNTSRTTTSNAIATGLPQSGEDNRTDATIVRNIFFNCDHGILLKEEAFATVVNNTFVEMSLAAMQFTEVGGTSVQGPGRGAYLDGNIFWHCAQQFKHLDQALEGATVHRSILPSAFHYMGRDNLDVIPLFVDPNDDLHLRSVSPATGTGPNGLDRGGYVPAGVSLSVKTYSTDAVITVAGPGITHYQYALNNPTGPWSSDIPVDQAIELSGLTEAQPYTVYAVGKNSAGDWQSTDQAASITWTVEADEIPLQISEVLALNQNAVLVEGEYPDLIELQNMGRTPLNLNGLSLTDDPDFPDRFVLTGGITLDPNEYLVLVADPNTEIPLHVGFALDARGEGLYLFGNGEIIDSVQFGPQVPDLSIGRTHDGAWRLTWPTFGQDNQIYPLAAPESLRINEWLANGQVLFVDDFIELYNPKPYPVNLSELYLTDNPVTQPGKHQIGPLSFVAANGFIEFDADDSDRSGHVDFRLSADVEEIALLDEYLHPIDRVLYAPQTTDVSEGALPDGYKGYTFFTLPTPRLSNTLASTPPTTFTLISQGANVQYFVPTDSTWQDNWMLPEFTELQSWLSDTTPLGFGDVYQAGKQGITAYNDCVYSSAEQYIAAYVTTYGIGSGYSGPTSGALKDQATGNDMGVTVSFEQSGGVNWQPGSDTGGSDTDAGTNAYELFHDIADMIGVIYYGDTDWWVEATFTGLDPSLRYRFATSANRDGPTDYEDRYTRYTLLDTDSHSNISSTGVIVNSPDSVSFSTGRNATNGYVAQWTDIDPGADGSFTVKAEAHGTPYHTQKAYSFDVFLLEALQTDNPLEQTMVGNYTSLWTRIDFNFNEEPADLALLTLKMRYDDAFVAYLNGQEVARNNFTGTPQWNSAADGNRDNALAAEFETFDISSHIQALQQGTNVLAVQILNESLHDPNLLFLPELVARTDPNNDISYEEGVALINGLRITEIMYHPPDAPAGNPDAEFIELKNVGPDPLNLTGVRFTQGIDFTFPALNLDPGQYVVVVKDLNTFQSQYGSIPEVIGQYDGSLSNGGENIALKLPFPLEAAILRFEYNDTWRPTTDGGGYALVINDPLAPAATWNDRAYWSAGSALGGSPGYAD